MPGNSRPYPQSRKNGKYATGQKKKTNGIDQKEGTVGADECDEGRGDRFHPASTHIEAMEIGMDPMPTALGQPMQDARCTISQRVIIVRWMNETAENCQEAQDQKAEWKPSAKPLFSPFETAARNCRGKELLAKNPS